MSNKKKRCTLCAKFVENEKDAIFPLSKKNMKGFIWAHYTCILETVHNLKDGEAPTFKCKTVCKHWSKKGFCSFRKGCFFYHPPMADERLKPPKVPNNSKEKNQSKRRTRGKTRREGRQRPKVANTSRASILRRFLIGKIGTQRLKQGSGILDVAGGKGELAFEFNHVNGIKATVCDPRPMLLQKFRRRYRLGLYHRNPAFAKHAIPMQPNITPDTSENELKMATPVKHLRLFFDERLFQWVASCNDDRNHINYDWFENSIEVARSTCWTNKGLVHEDDECNTQGADSDDGSISCCCDLHDNTEKALSFQNAVEETKCNDGEGVVVKDYKECLEILLNATAVVGMHPDQAAEHICDFALKQDIPFALVPCCVYSKQFPKRKLPDGKLVKSYEQLLEHLQSKDPRIRRNRLPFEGKNIVLWFDPNLEPVKKKKNEKSEGGKKRRENEIKIFDELDSGMDQENDEVSSLIFKAVIEEIASRKEATVMESLTTIDEDNEVKV